MKENESAKQLTLAETHKLARTIESLEVTGLQLAIIVNSIAFALSNPEMLPEDLKSDAGYAKSTEDLYDYVSDKIEIIIGRRT